VWGALIQANTGLFEPEYRVGAPGEVVYDPQGRVGPRELEAVGRLLFSLKEEAPADPDCQSFSEYLRDGRIRVFARDAPRRVLPYPLKVSSTYFDQMDLPDGMLTLSRFPVLVSDRCPGAVMVLPHRFWPAGLVERWCSTSQSKFGRAVRAEDLKSKSGEKQILGPSMYEEGLIYFHGHGVPQDRLKAKQLWEEAARLGHLESMNNLGVMHDHGDGVAANLQSAFDWYQRAAEGGLALGQLNLGKAYLRFDGVEPNVTKGQFWLQRAAEQGNEEASQLLRDITPESAAPPVPGSVARIWKSVFR
jgi:hypothetical protein